MKLLTTLTAIMIAFAGFGQTWERGVDMPATAEGRNHPITFSIGDTGYVLTGYSRSGASGFDMADFYKFDSKSGTWTKGDDFPGGSRGFGYGVSHNGKGYAGFGLEGGRTPKNDLWEYDPGTGRWKQLASCPCTPRWHPAMAATNGKVYMGLGGMLTGDLKDWYSYDIATDTWTKHDDLPGPQRHHPYYFALGDDVYAGLGHHRQDIYNTFFKFNTRNNTWTQVASLPAEGRVAGTQFDYNGKGYVLSGQGQTHDYLTNGEFWEYDPDNNTWTALTSHPGRGRWAPGTFVIENTVYFLAGETPGYVQNRDVWTYSFPVFTSLENSISEKNGISVFPNPAQSQLFVRASGLNSVNVMNGLGQTMEVSSSILSGDEVSLDISGLISGVYLLRVETETGSEIRKIIKQ